MSMGSASRVKADPIFLAAADRVRSGAYGGLVGQMLSDIDARMMTDAPYADAKEAPEDFLHSVSVTCGYVGLIVGIGAVATALLKLF